MITVLFCKWFHIRVAEQIIDFLPNLEVWSDAQLAGGREGMEGGGGHLCSFLKIEEKCPDFAKKVP